MTTRKSQRIGLSGALNGTRRGQASFSQNKGGATVKGTGISFTASNTIADSGNQLAVLAVGARIEVRGSPRNSRIFDVDVAAETTRLARANILVQSGAAMLAQANAASQIALKLLQ